jgi:hypothetical protein
VTKRTPLFPIAASKSAATLSTRSLTTDASTLFLHTVTINPAECVKDFGLYNWSVKRFGPYIICRDGTVTFQWRGMHGLFQIPTIACPSNFTSQEAETYKFLAPASNGGGFEWKVPNKTGHYWVTSQWQNDCRNGERLRSEIDVVHVCPFQHCYKILLKRKSLTMTERPPASLLNEYFMMQV